MRYLPHTSQDIQEMLQLIGLQDISELFDCIPESLRLKTDLPLPHPLPELQLRKQLRRLSRKNAHGDEWMNFLGAGTYRHYVPSATRQLIMRGEFLTAYTPYQAEVSQGTLQALFEFQTMVSELMGLEIATASHYDGATAAAEAVLMADRIHKHKKKVLIARSLNPRYRDVIKTYLRYTDIQIEEVPFDSQTGEIDKTALRTQLDDTCGAVLISSPNFFGILENLSDIADDVHNMGALLITSTPEPWSLALVKSPGDMGADIATAEGQSFGNAMNFGGPSLGLFATHEKFARQVPGRLIGETIDSKGQRAYVLTLATREQHIRRERATSNICTNVSLCAIAATITLSLLGPEGYRQIALDNLRKADAAKKLLQDIPGVRLALTGPTFNEFVITTPLPPAELLERLRRKQILAGVALDRFYPELTRHLLINVTEMNTYEEISELARQLNLILGA